MLHMIVEQTDKYPRRMVYDAVEKVFHESEYASLMYVRKFSKPYGWIKESGTPPEPHWDCMLMTDAEKELGDEVEIKVIGVFKRKDGDHKYIVVETARDIEDYAQLSDGEKEELSRLYPRIDAGEGWFGREEAEECMKRCEKAL